MSFFYSVRIEMNLCSMNNILDDDFRCACIKSIASSILGNTPQSLLQRCFLYSISSLWYYFIVCFIWIKVAHGVSFIFQAEKGGFKTYVMEVKGSWVYSKLKYESGVHRVQRVPQTEAQGRVHTSTATVAIMPEVKCDSLMNDTFFFLLVFIVSDGCVWMHVQLWQY